MFLVKKTFLTKFFEVPRSSVCLNRDDVTMDFDENEDVEEDEGCFTSRSSKDISLSRMVRFSTLCASKNEIRETLVEVFSAKATLLTSLMAVISILVTDVVCFVTMTEIIRDNEAELTIPDSTEFEKTSDA